MGRESGYIRLTVCYNTQQITIEKEMLQKSLSNSTIHTDESHAYFRLDKLGFEHYCVCHSKKEYARDDDGDEFCEVHCNTMEGIWTGLRNSLRPYRGVHKKYLAQYVVIFEWAYNLKNLFQVLIRAMVIPDYTFKPI